MDGPVESTEELRGNLRDIERANRWLGGTSTIKRHLSFYAVHSIVDIGCGACDIPLVLLASAARSGRPLAITCVDASSQMLDIARERAGQASPLTFVQAFGETLPFVDRNFDVAMCNLTLHHFDPQPAVQMLREMRRVSRFTPLVCDLRRTPIGIIGAWVFSRLVSRNRLTRYDAPLSARRAYTPLEAYSLARDAGWKNPVVRQTPFSRMVMFDA